MSENSNETKLALLRELYPQLTEAELLEAKEQIDQYLKVVKNIMESLRNDPKLQAKYEELKAQYKALTESEGTDTVNVVEY